MGLPICFVTNVLFFLLDSSENLPPTVRYNRKACRHPSHCPVHSYVIVQNLQSPIHWYTEVENLRHIHIFKSSIVEPFHLYVTCNGSCCPRRPLVGYPIEFIVYCTSLKKNFFGGRGGGQYLTSLISKTNLKSLSFCLTWLWYASGRVPLSILVSPRPNHQ